MEKVVGHSFQEVVTWQAAGRREPVPCSPREGVGEAGWAVYS